MSKKYLVVVECAIEYEGRFLIIKRPAGGHAGGLLAFPGGKVDVEDEKNSFDTLTHAVKREVLEEVGLNLVDKIEYVTSSFFVDNQGTPIIDVIFHCELKETNIAVVASAREVPEFYWMTPEEINTAANCPEWLKKYLHQIKK